jgi:hypothetical protein
MADETAGATIFVNGNVVEVKMVYDDGAKYLIFTLTSASMVNEFIAGLVECRDAIWPDDDKGVFH